MLEAELFALLERTSDAAFAVTETGEICFWSKAAERLFGYRAPDAVGKRSAELLDGHGALGTKVCLEPTLPLYGARGGENRDFDLRVRTSSGIQVWVNVSTILFEEPRRSRRLIVHLARDISHRKRNEELLAKVLEVAQEALAPETEKAVLPWFRSRSMRSGFCGSSAQARIQLRLRKSWALP